MALYDILDEITERKVTKTETGDTRISGVVVGTVAKNYEETMGGRVCVTIPTRVAPKGGAAQGDQSVCELQWARVAMLSSGKDWGHYFLPEVGDQVLLAFEGGNIEKPYVIGCVSKDKDGFLKGSVDKDNRTKRIVTKHGSTIAFDDDPSDADGAKDKITIQTAGEAHTVVLDNANKLIRISDKAKEDFIEMKTEEGSGSLTIKVKSKLTIEVGDTVKLVLNGESGNVKLEANVLKVEASNQIGLKTDSMLKLEGGTIVESASSSFKIDSGGAVKIGGAPISIG